ncbi:ABC transporter substrate-binding protein [Natronolimnobius sp. AArcel1]|uniref:ABC transporter substrate-binding protein n=1 Tax=Natronolimnobius sp. AArcel1 TaxID=1679093 RepID=UPI001F151806|nr:ABC transporter substrate-binding protein [Natronolimnobius sp. AArcel1]
MSRQNGSDILSKDRRNGKGTPYAVSRRQVLSAAGGTGAMLVAGCAGGGDDENGGAADERPSFDPDEDERVDTALIQPTTDNPTNWQYNIYNPSQEFGHEMNNDQFVWYHMERDEFTWRLIDIAEYEDDHALVDLADDRYWHSDGENVDAEDLRTKLILEDIMSGDLGAVFEDVSISGDHQVEMDLAGTINPEVFDTSWTNMWLDTRADQYDQFVERWEDGESIDDIRPDLENYELDEIEGHGPFEAVNVTDNLFEMELVEDHPDADQINFTRWEIHRVGSDTGEVLMGNEVDTIRNFTAEDAVLDNRPDDLTVGHLPAMWGMALPFNLDHEHVGNVRVRQALAEFIDREGVASSYGPYGEAVEAPSGLVGNIDGENNPSDAWTDWITDEGADALHRYDDVERGRDLLREEGYSRDDEQWYTPDDEEFELTITMPADTTDWHPVYQTVEGQLRQEGINADVEAVDDTVYWSDYYLDGDYDLASTGWTLQNSYPYFTFRMYYIIDAQYLNLDTDDVVAPPIGEPDGDLESVDVVGLLEELQTTQDEAESVELIEEIAWVTNQYLPMLPLTEINDTVWFWEDEWWVPDPVEESETYQSKWPLWQFPRTGNLRAR